MFKKPCRCGTSQKSFRHDIGPYYVDECCEHTDPTPTYTTADASGTPLVSVEGKLSKKKLKAMRVEDLRTYGQSQGRAPEELTGLNKIQLIELLK